MKIRDLILHLMVLLVLSACASGSGRQGTQITVTGSGPTTQVLGGSTVVFVMTVTNSGPYDASNIKLVDNVGNQLKLLSITCTATGGATCPTTPSVEMVIPAMPNGGSLVFSVTTQLDSGATGTVENSMTSSFAEEIDPTGDSAVATATAFSVVTNVVVSGTGPTGTLIGGSTAVFVMKVTNNGPDAATGFNVYDNVGNGLALTGITCAASGGAVCPANVTVLTAVDTLPSGGVLTFTVTTQIGQNVNGTISNQMVADIRTNPTPSSDSVYATATVVTADLSVSGTPPPGPLLPGSAAVFTMVITNNGPGTAQNINITNALSSTITASGAITCVPTNGAVCPATLGPTMTLASMPDTGVLTFTVPFTVNAGTSGQVTDTMTVSSTTDPRGNQVATIGTGSGNSGLIVTETGSAQVNAGSNAVFNAVVSNAGPSSASNVSVSYSLAGPAGTVATVGCTASAGTSCPTTLGPVMTVPSIPVGRALSFTFTVPVPKSAAGAGAIINTVTVSAVGNSGTQTVASFSTVPINSNNGTYQVFAANGNQYTMVINFDSTPPTYTISGNGQNFPESFTADASGGGYRVSGTSRFQVATDLIVGGQDFGTGVIPYVAARVFGTTVQQLNGTSGGAYDLVTLSLPAGHPTTTAAGTARVSGNTLAICQQTNAVSTPQSCPTASLQNYALSVNGNVYTGIETITAQPYTFQEALIGASAALFWAGPPTPGGTPQFIIGLPDSATLAGGVTQGPSTTGDFVQMTLTTGMAPNTYQYAYTGQLGSSDNATLPRAQAAPFSLLSGDLESDGAQIYVMQAFPLSVAFGGSGAANGLLQVTIPCGQPPCMIN